MKMNISSPTRSETNPIHPNQVLLLPPPVPKSPQPPRPLLSQPPANIRLHHLIHAQQPRLDLAHRLLHARRVRPRPAEREAPPHADRPDRIEPVRVLHDRQLRVQANKPARALRVPHLGAVRHPQADRLDARGEVLGRAEGPQQGVDHREGVLAGLEVFPVADVVEEGREGYQPDVEVLAEVVCRVRIYVLREIYHALNVLEVV